MKEYIEREAVLKAIETDCLEQVYYSKEDAIWCVKAAPAADVVEVVRCKDCKHLVFSDFYGECSKTRLGIVRPDDFCSYGERRE